MNLNSKLFDRIRIKSRQPEAPKPKVAPPCAWIGCDRDGIYRAPKGRVVGEYHHFCLEHVRHYNNAFNFFAGMNPEEMAAAFDKAAGTAGEARSERGANPAYRGPRAPRSREQAAEGRRFSDPLNIFARYTWAQSKRPSSERVKPMHEPDRRAFEALGFSGQARSDDIKKAYKKLVKIHHPDANGGDRASEDRLRSIIAAYTHLKAKGFVGG